MRRFYGHNYKKSVFKNLSFKKIIPITQRHKNARDAFTVIMDKKVFRTQCFLHVQSLARLHKLRIIFYHKSFTGKS